MIFNLFSFQLTVADIGIILFVALLTGMSKTGVHGTGMLSAPLLVWVFGGHQASGVILPLLLIADVFGVWYYHRHASWQHLKILFPWAAVGVIAGTLFGSYVNDSVFKLLMALTIAASLLIMLWLERQGDTEKIPRHKSFARATGVAGGFISMMGNVAGAVMSVYLLSIRLPKNVFIGTTAWFFLVINWFKVPFHVWVWHTITWNTVLLDLLTLPVILLGAWLGIIIVRQLSDKAYRWFIIGMTLVAAIGMFL